MPAYFHRTPFYLRWWFCNALWKKKLGKNKEVFLTFDDGPIPEVTPWVLAELNRVGAKATFFAVGDNVKKYPDIFNQVLAEGNKYGNHTFNHIKGWEHSTRDYLQNTAECEIAFEKLNYNNTQPKLFRPPHGRMTKKQSRSLRKKDYTLVMWDVLSGDFDPTLSKEDCLANTIKATRAGSIIVFHDSVKTYDTLKYVLPRYLDYLCAEGYQMKTL